jgi:hypothetical protein
MTTRHLPRNERLHLLWTKSFNLAVKAWENPDPSIAMEVALVRWRRRNRIYSTISRENNERLDALIRSIGRL